MDGSVNFSGYHGTFFDNCDSIMNEGFIIPKPKELDDHWLGHGIYFYDSYDLAYWWAEKKSISFRKKRNEKHTPIVIYCNLSVPQNKVLNLDVNKQLGIFAEYCNAKTEELKLTAYQFHVQKEGDVPSADQIRCFFLDLYKTENDIGIIIYTFHKPMPSYAKSLFKFGGYINLGLEYKETQYCVTSNDFIKDKYLYHSREEYI
ncbi:MAG TPA: hypothetical protein VM577_02395 [Anaerovoracaceae bacterium]|nr:hypothetical protein [Anaerovoracaceae bacterium]